MTFDFMFEPGYVQADDSKDRKPGNDNHKLSFFPNSGIKIWGLYEMAIFDSRQVKNLTGMAGVEGSSLITADGYGPPEIASSLMTGVAYNASLDQSDSPANVTSATIYRADERLVSRVLLSPGPHQAFPGPHGFPLRSGLFLAFARSLSESGGLAVLS